MSDKRTCLYDRHLQLGAKMVPFGGFEMPLYYSDITTEHEAVRHHCGVFDICHMGNVHVSGPEALPFIQHIFTNDASKAAIGQDLYGMMLHPTGGIVDDLLVYRLDEDAFNLVINASNIDKDVAWIEAHAKDFDVTVRNESGQRVQIAVQGPEAEAIIEEVLGLPCKDLTFYHHKQLSLQHPFPHELTISRTGYTGEDGFELYSHTEAISYYWDQLIASHRVTPCGLGCRDTLRFEVGLPLYGDELNDTLTPLNAGLGIFVKFDKPNFIGKEALLRQKEEGLDVRLVGIELADRAIARHGYDVEHEGQVIGHVTTGYQSISTGKSVCMAYVLTPFAALGSTINVRIHKKLHSGTIVKKRFYEKHYKN